MSFNTRQSPGQQFQPFPTGNGFPMHANNPKGLTEEQEEAINQSRYKIIKIVLVSLFLSSLIVVISFVFTVSPQDKTLYSHKDFSVNGATYIAPKSWKSDTSNGLISYYNGDSEESSSVVISAFIPQRLKYNQEPLTQHEIEAVIGELGNLDSRNVNGVVTVTSQREINPNGFAAGYEYKYETDANTLGNFRVYFDEQSNVHGFEVVAVKSYWQNNQSEINEIINSYTPTQ